MSSTIDMNPEVEAYLASVRDQLDDLPDADRDDLLGEVEASLFETAADEGSIEERLGPPAEFARELRAAAGLGAPVSRPVRRWTRLAAAGAVVRGFPYRDLAPIWWILRAYVAVAAFGFVFDWSWRHPALPRIVDAEVTGLLLVAAAIASVWLGRRGKGRRRISIAANAIAIAVAVPVLFHAFSAHAPATVVFVPVAPEPTPGLSYDGVQIDNVYPYSRGKLLHDVLLYDGAGRPIVIGGPTVLDPNRRVPRTSGGAPLYNAFPIRYYEPGTRRIAHPNAAPPIRRKR